MEPTKWSATILHLHDIHYTDSRTKHCQIRTGYLYNIVLLRGQQKNDEQFLESNTIIEKKDVHGSSSVVILDSESESEELSLQLSEPGVLGSE